MARMYLIAKSVLPTPRLHLEAFSNEALRTAVDDSTVMRSLRFRAGCTFQPTGAQARSRRENVKGRRSDVTRRIYILAGMRWCSVNCRRLGTQHSLFGHGSRLHILIVMSKIDAR